MALVLAELLADPLAAAVLRRHAADLSPGVLMRSDSDVLERVKRAIVSRRLALVPTEFLRPAHQGGSGQAKARDDFKEIDRPFKPTDTAWIEIQLVDEDGQPVCGQAYTIITPDGHTHRGYTDSLGTARITRIHPGACTVSFPDLDAGSWEALASAGEG